MISHARLSPRLVSVPALTLMLICGFAYFAPGKGLPAAAAQSTSLSGSFGFLINNSLSQSDGQQGFATLGMMNFDGAGSVTGSYTFQSGAIGTQQAQTGFGALAPILFT